METYSLGNTMVSSTVHFLFLDVRGLSLLAGVEIVVNSGVLVPTWRGGNDLQRRPTFVTPK